mmetsp:Transcript_15759/g.23192  ORF Transcript_15759/g.23192 Transcript_15759/m.23192 type:complete len:238 (+) Transcript_15759:523-1236(+)
MKLCFYNLKGKGFEYSFDKDFNDRGEFHGVMIQLWTNIRAKDPTYGTSKHAAQMIEDADRKIMNTMKSGELRPYEDPTHAIMIMGTVHGRYLAFRGSKEHVKLKISNVFIGRYGDDAPEDMAGLIHYSTDMVEEKTRPLNFKWNKAGDQKKVLSVTEDPTAFLCPVKFAVFYLSRCLHLHKPNPNRVIYKLLFCFSFAFAQGDLSCKHKIGRHTPSYPTSAVGLLAAPRQPSRPLLG